MVRLREAAATSTNPGKRAKQPAGTTPASFYGNRSWK
jgi:hypothetical protein